MEKNNALEVIEVNVEKKHNFSELALAESNLRIVRLMQRVEELTGKESVSANKDFVAFVGPTKSGKSTLINCLLGTQLICKRDVFEDTYIVKAPNASGPNIGGSGESETETPVGYKNVPGTNFAMWDFPGFGDNKGTEQEIVNAISYHAVLFSQNVRFVLVVPYHLIKEDNPLPFYTLLCELHKICPQIADSLCIVSSKGSYKVDLLLSKAKSRQFSKVEKVNNDIISRGKMIIERVLENGTYVGFKSPVLEEEVDEKPFTLPNKQEFIDCIKKLKVAKLHDFPLLINIQGKYDIAELYTAFYWELKRDVDNIVSSLEQHVKIQVDEILLAIDENGKQTSASSRLAVFKVGKRRMEDLLKESKDFETFFAQIKKAGQGINERFAENIKKFIFIEKLKNLYKIDDEKSVNGVLEFFSNIKAALMSAANTYSSLIAASTAATKEERRVEQEWQKKHNDEIKALNERIKFLQNENSPIVRTARAISNVVTAVSEALCVIS